MKYLMKLENFTESKIYIKTFENKEIDHKIKLSKIDFDALTKKYKDHFFLCDKYMREYDWEKKDFSIVLVDKIEPHESTSPLNHLYNPYGDSFTVYKNGEIKNPGGWGMSNTQEEFDNIHFMSAIEFYKEHEKLCEKLFLKIINELKIDKWSPWYLETLKRYSEVLETVPELQYIRDSEKYNL